MNLFQAKTIELRSVASDLIESASIGVWWANNPKAHQSDAQRWIYARGRKMLVLKKGQQDLKTGEKFHQLCDLFLPSRDVERAASAAFQFAGGFIPVKDFWLALYHVVECHLTGRPVEKKTVVTIVKEGIGNPIWTGEFLEEDSFVPEAIRIYGTIEFTARESLLRYLRLFLEEPKLKDYDPIGKCPSCGSLFLKKKLSQSFCTGKCYQTSWSNLKLKEDPDYFARKARESRLARSSMRVAHQNAVGKIVGELPPKPIKIHRKPRKP